MIPKRHKITKKHLTFQRKKPATPIKEKREGKEMWINSYRGSPCSRPARDCRRTKSKKCRRDNHERNKFIYPRICTIFETYNARIAADVH